MDKLTSRKFWVCIAAMLASIATSIAGVTTDNQAVLIIGTVCGVMSAAIYAFCEAWVDASAAEKSVNVDDVIEAIIDELSKEDSDDE